MINATLTAPRFESYCNGTHFAVAGRADGSGADTAEPGKRGACSEGVALRVQVHNNHILTQNLYYNDYYPSPIAQFL